MKQHSLFSKFVSWLASPEVFGNVSKSLVGTWFLFEYYMDEREELVHMREFDLQREKQQVVITFFDDEFEVNAHISVPLVARLKKGRWSVAKNFITFIDPENFRNNVEFQFAFEKGNIKLLKKDERGMIEFFGFFKPAVDAQKSN
ncbi:MAG: hypothetical protein ACK5HT_00375 [Draconibacterium sp.]